MNTQLHATHFVGSEITYKCLGSNKYEITLSLYRDCNGTLFNSTDSITASCNSTSKNFILPKIKTEDVTGLNPKCQINSRCMGSYKYGIEKYVYIDTIDLNSFNCCEIIISHKGTSRSSSITTGASYDAFYNEALLNKCITPCNSSPVFSSKPTFLASIAESITIKNYAIDTVDIGDSLSYKLVDPLRAKGVRIPYSGIWEATKPLTFTGFPNNTLQSPAGFHFDSTNGDIHFRPIIKNQVTVLAIEVTEWRRINGVTTKIGVTRRDIQLNIVDINTKPKATFDNTPKIFAVCSLQGTFCKDIALARPSGYNDTIALEYTTNLQNISFTNTGTVSNPKIRVCYTPTVAEANASPPPSFTIKAITNSCPLLGVAEKTFQWEVRPFLPDSFTIKKELSCRNLKISLDNTTGFNNAEAVIEVVESNNRTTTRKTNTLEINALADSGWQKIKMVVEDYEYCGSRTCYDSIYVPLSHFLAVKVPKDTMACNAKSISILANTINGTLPFSFNWSGDDTSSLPLLNTTITKTTNKYAISVSDANNCKVSDTVLVRYYNPQVTLSGDSIACAGDEVEVNATFTNTVKPIYQWIGFGLGQATFIAQVSRNSLLAFALVDSSGCALFKTHFVRVYAPKVNYTHNNVFCADDTILLSLNKSGGLPPYAVKWLPYNTFGDSLNLGLQNKSKIDFSTVITDAYGCVDSQTQSIRINKVPKVSLTPIAPVCESDSFVLLNNYVQPSNGVWSGVAVTDNVFKPYVSGVGKKSLSFLYVDSFTYCSKTINTEVEVQTQPVASFIVDSTKANFTHSFEFTNTSKFGAEHSFLWDFGDPVSGLSNWDTAKNTTHTFSDTGSYSIKLVVSGGVCHPDSIIKTNYIQVVDYSIDTSTVSTKNVKGVNSLKVYPNPTTSSLIIESDKGISVAEIHDMLGRRVFSEVLQNTRSIEVDVTLLPAGSYTLSITYSNSSAIKTIQFLKE
jgi:hypothetical protein